MKDLFIPSEKGQGAIVYFGAVPFEVVVGVTPNGDEEVPAFAVFYREATFKRCYLLWTKWKD